MRERTLKFKKKQKLKYYYIKTQKKYIISVFATPFHLPILTDFRFDFLAIGLNVFVLLMFGGELFFPWFDAIFHGKNRSKSNIMGVFYYCFTLFRVESLGSWMKRKTLG